METVQYAGDSSVILCIFFKLLIFFRFVNNIDWLIDFLCVLRRTDMF